MVKLKNNKKIGVITRFISSEKGQRFFNFAYSIGAAVVIWGALFKILHLPGGNTLLSIGMGTEVMMFLLTAFDRPPKEYEWEKVYPALAEHEDGEEAPMPAQGGVAVAGGGGGTVIIGGVPAAGQEIVIDGEPHQGGAGGVVTGGVIGGGVIGGMPAGIIGASAADIAATADNTEEYSAQVGSLAEEMKRLHELTNELNNVSEVLLGSYKAITQHSEEISDSSTGYVDQMQNLNRNIAGLNTIYEIQLKSVSSQLDAIDRVNRGIKDIRDMYERSAEMSTLYCEETEKMARYMQQLNQVYERMITAMTVNNPQFAVRHPQNSEQETANSEQ